VENVEDGKMAVFCEKHAKEFVGDRQCYPELTNDEYHIMISAWIRDLCEKCKEGKK
jgi:hypothetical protein